MRVSDGPNQKGGERGWTATVNNLKKSNTNFGEIVLQVIKKKVPTYTSVYSC